MFPCKSRGPLVLSFAGFSCDGENRVLRARVCQLNYPAIHGFSGGRGIFLPGRVGVIVGAKVIQECTVFNIIYL